MHICEIIRRMVPDKNPLLRRLEDQRFLRAVDYVRQASSSIKKINSGELLHLNQILIDSSEETWRYEAVDVRLPSGQLHQLNLLSNPVARARELIGDALQVLGGQKPEEAALGLYCDLIIAHLFLDANRRTAALATIWILELAGQNVDPIHLLQIPVGNLREPADRKDFSDRFVRLISQP